MKIYDLQTPLDFFVGKTGTSASTILISTLCDLSIALIKRGGIVTGARGAIAIAGLHNPLESGIPCLRVLKTRYFLNCYDIV